MKTVGMLFATIAAIDILLIVALLMRELHLTGALSIFCSLADTRLTKLWSVWVVRKAVRFIERGADTFIYLATFALFFIPFAIADSDRMAIRILGYATIAKVLAMSIRRYQRRKNGRT